MRSSSRPEMEKYTKFMDAIVLLQLTQFLLLPISTTLFFIVSPDNPMHPRHIIPKGIKLKDNPIFIFVSLIFITWTSCIAWYTFMRFMIVGTIYFSKLYTFLVFMKSLTWCFTIFLSHYSLDFIGDERI